MNERGVIRALTAGEIDIGPLDVHRVPALDAARATSLIDHFVVPELAAYSETRGRAERVARAEGDGTAAWPQFPFSSRTDPCSNRAEEMDSNKNIGSGTTVTGVGLKPPSWFWGQ